MDIVRSRFANFILALCLPMLVASAELKVDITEEAGNAFRKDIADKIGKK